MIDFRNDVAGARAVLPPSSTRAKVDRCTTSSAAASDTGRCAPPDLRTRRWWLRLCAISAGNVALWIAVAWMMRGPSNTYVVQQLVLSGIYVAVCAFRSFLPRVDLERRCLWDTPLSSIFLGRSLATIAELCFAGQCALFLSKLSVLSGHESLRIVALSIVPLIVVAQLACWYAVVSLNHLGHALEELLWAVMVISVAVGLALSWSSMTGAGRILIPLGFVACAGASYVMLVVDVPMYVARWRQHQSRGVQYLPVGQGLKDALSRRQVTGGWSEWRQEVVWMSLYFSVGVWLSLGFVFV